MAGRTFAIGDIHGDAVALDLVLSRMPAMTYEDTLVLLGDYIDRGPASKQVVDRVRRLAFETPARVIPLRGNHEDAWLRVVEHGWPEFVLPPLNGALATMRSYTGGPHPEPEDPPRPDEVEALLSGRFFPPDVVEWMRALPYWYEDEHAIYVHAGLPFVGTRFPHPSEVENPVILLWCRDTRFFRDYRGKTIVFGHTATEYLPPELSTHTPEDPTDIWAGPCTWGLDTGAGRGGFLTGLELPAKNIFESRG